MCVSLLVDKQPPPVPISQVDELGPFDQRFFDNAYETALSCTQVKREPVVCHALRCMSGVCVSVCV